MSLAVEAVMKYTLILRRGKMSLIHYNLCPFAFNLITWALLPFSVLFNIANMVAVTVLFAHNYDHISCLNERKTNEEIKQYLFLHFNKKYIVIWQDSEFTSICTALQTCVELIVIVYLFENHKTLQLSITSE